MNAHTPPPGIAELIYPEMAERARDQERIGR